MAPALSSRAGTGEGLVRGLRHPHRLCVVPNLGSRPVCACQAPPVPNPEPWGGRPGQPEGDAAHCPSTGCSGEPCPAASVMTTWQHVWVDIAERLRGLGLQNRRPRVLLVTSEPAGETPFAVGPSVAAGSSSFCLVSPWGAVPGQPPPPAPLVLAGDLPCWALPHEDSARALASGSRFGLWCGSARRGLYCRPRRCGTLRTPELLPRASSPPCGGC